MVVKITKLSLMILFLTLILGVASFGAGYFLSSHIHQPPNPTWPTPPSVETVLSACIPVPGSCLPRGEALQGETIIIRATISPLPSTRTAEVWEKPPGRRWFLRVHLPINGDGSIIWNWNTTREKIAVDISGPPLYAPKPYQLQFRIGALRSNVIRVSVFSGE